MSRGCAFLLQLLVPPPPSSPCRPLALGSKILKKNNGSSTMEFHQTVFRLAERAVQDVGPGPGLIEWVQELRRRGGSDEGRPASRRRSRPATFSCKVFLELLRIVLGLVAAYALFATVSLHATYAGGSSRNCLKVAFERVSPFSAAEYREQLPPSAPRESLVAAKWAERSNLPADAIVAVFLASSAPHADELQAALASNDSSVAAAVPDYEFGKERECPTSEVGREAWIVSPPCVSCPADSRCPSPPTLIESYAALGYRTTALSLNKTADETVELAATGTRLIVGVDGEELSVTTPGGREKVLLARRDHSVVTVNVIVDRSACGYGKSFLADLDTIMVLEAMATFVSRGTLRNIKTRESWAWSLSNILDAVPTIRSDFFGVSG